MALVEIREDTHLGRIIESFEQSPPFERLLKAIHSPDRANLTATGLAGSSGAILLAGLADRLPHPIIAVTAGIEEANDLHDDLAFLLGEDRAGLFPARQAPPYDFRSPSAEVAGRRLATLGSLLDNTIKVVIAPVQAIIEPTMAREEFERTRLYLKVGMEFDLEELAVKLIAMGFRRVTLVEEVGDFALRGGLVDFFSPGFDAPVRVEFFGDEIDTIRQFDVGSQRTTERLNEVNLLPRREVSITQETVEHYIERLPEQDGDLVRARFLNDPELPGLEWLAPAFGLPFDCLTDYVDNRALYCLTGEGSLEAECDDILEISTRQYERMSKRMSAVPSDET